LLTIAEKIFGERGYYPASIREIAREAGLSVGGVYQFVGGKSELYLNVVEAQWVSVQATLARALRHEGCLEQLRELTRGLLEHLEERKEFLRVRTSELSAFPPPLKRQVAAAVSRRKTRFRRQLVRLMSHGVETGTLRPIDAELLASAYLGLLYVSAEDTLKGNSPARLTNRADHLLSVFLHGVALPGSPKC
jgi:AcrR family transcriptional regulator